MWGGSKEEYSCFLKDCWVVKTLFQNSVQNTIFVSDCCLHLFLLTPPDSNAIWICHYLLKPGIRFQFHNLPGPCLCHCHLKEKKSFVMFRWNLLCFSSCSSPLVLSQGITEKSLTLYLLLATILHPELLPPETHLLFGIKCLKALSEFVTYEIKTLYSFTTQGCFGSEDIALNCFHIVKGLWRKIEKYELEVCSGGLLSCRIFLRVEWGHFSI